MNKIKESINYLDECYEALKLIPKKLKFYGTLLTLTIGILVIIPFAAIFVSYFMLYLGIKSLIITAIVIIGLLIYIFFAVMTPIYFKCVFLLAKKEDINFKKIFIASICDYVTFIFIAILIIAFCIFLNFMY